MFVHHSDFNLECDIEGFPELKNSCMNSLVLCKLVTLGTDRVFPKDSAILLCLKSRIWKHQSWIGALYFAITVDGLFFCLCFFSLFCIYLSLYFCFVASELHIRFFFFFETITPKHLFLQFSDTKTTYSVFFFSCCFRPILKKGRLQSEPI